MQEFNVWNCERNIGRCDFLFRIKDKNEEIDIITEAKLYPLCSDWYKINNIEFYKGILDQALNTTRKKEDIIRKRLGYWHWRLNGLEMKEILKKRKIS